MNNHEEATIYQPIRQQDDREGKEETISEQPTQERNPNKEISFCSAFWKNLFCSGIFCDNLGNYNCFILTSFEQCADAAQARGDNGIGTSCSDEDCIAFYSCCGLIPLAAQAALLPITVPTSIIMSFYDIYKKSTGSDVDKN